MGGNENEEINYTDYYEEVRTLREKIVKKEGITDE